MPEWVCNGFSQFHCAWQLSSAFNLLWHKTMKQLLVQAIHAAYYSDQRLGYETRILRLVIKRLVFLFVKLIRNGTFSSPISQQWHPHQRPPAPSTSQSPDNSHFPDNTASSISFLSFCAKPKVLIMMHSFWDFAWVMNLKKSNLTPPRSLECLGLILNSAQAKAFLPMDKLW